ncbi:MAG TPA: hypothetical protein VH330_07130 [Candidatus Udaeobacter sp.]
MKHHPVALIVDFQFTSKPFGLFWPGYRTFLAFVVHFVISFYGAEAAKFREKWTDTG